MVEKAKNSRLEQVEAHCNSLGIRLTEKRRQVLFRLVQSEKALSAYDIISLHQGEYGESLPAMSVYRILGFLESFNLVHKLKLANKYVACVHLLCDHSHQLSQFLICVVCSKVSEVSITPQITKQLRDQVVTAGFELASPQIELNCICNACKKLGIKK